MTKNAKMSSQYRYYLGNKERIEVWFCYNSEEMLWNLSLFSPVIYVNGYNFVDMRKVVIVVLE